MGGVYGSATYTSISCASKILLKGCMLGCRNSVPDKTSRTTPFRLVCENLIGYQLKEVASMYIACVVTLVAMFPLPSQGAE